MRSVDVTSFFSARAGGIATYYRQKASHLHGRGVECHFVVPGRSTRTRRLGGATLHEVAGPPLPGGVYRLFGDLRGLRRLLADLAPDVVELASHYLLPDLVAGAPWRGRPPALIGFYHADYPDTYVGPALARLGAPRRLRRRAVGAAWWWVRRQHARYAFTLAASTHVERALRDHGVARVRRVGLGVDLDRFRPRAQHRAPAGPPKLLYVGRLSRDKGYDVLLAACDEIHRRSGAVVEAAGIGPLGGGGRSPARRGLRELGPVSPAEVPALLDGCAALIAPGGHESFSLAAAEAMASAVPVVGADRGGNRELIERSGGGVLFRTGCAVDLARAATALLASPPLERAAMARAGRAHVAAHHAWPPVFERILATYEEARR